MKRIVIDLDGTITAHETSSYEDVAPNLQVIEALRRYKSDGFEIVIFSSRNMRTYEGEVGKINIHTLPVIMAWLERHDVPHDQVIVGKPWCGFEGFYVDDKTVRPSEFARMRHDEIQALLAAEKT
jgi:capsule biosynthesis phosphatase